MVVYYKVIVVVVDVVVRLGLVASVVGGNVGLIAFIVDCEEEIISWWYTTLAGGRVRVGTTY